MKKRIGIITFIIINSFCSYGQNRIRVRQRLPGNQVVERVQDKNDKQFFTDPIDDTTNYKKWIDNIYIDKDSHVYIRSACLAMMTSDTSLTMEYFKDVSDFLDIKTYRKIRKGFFENKGKVFMWWGNSDGDYPIEVIGADPKTFVPFDSVGGGTDKQHVFYDGAPGDFKIIEGADPNTIKVLNPERGCWNCGSCYFVDAKSVYYGLMKIKGADPTTFKLLNKEEIDAVDKNGKYYEGLLIK